MATAKKPVPGAKKASPKTPVPGAKPNKADKPFPGAKPLPSKTAPKGPGKKK